VGDWLDYLARLAANWSPSIVPRLRKSQGFVPTVIVTDKLGSYVAAFRDLDP
jgi:transposase-like protein